MNKTSTYFYKDKPLFGLDIGFSSIKVMQLENHGKDWTVLGYGVGAYDEGSIKDGVIVDHEHVATAILELFKKNIIGEINTRRVALTLPATHTFSRAMNLPLIRDEEIEEAVNLEAEQYIPIAAADLYMDYEVIERTDKNIELLAVAVPKKIVDSYFTLCQLLGLEPIAFDTSTNAAGRLFDKQDEYSDIPAAIIDFGSISADITIRDKTSIVSSTITGGGDTYTSLIAKKLGVSKEEAHVIKTKYGISKSKRQADIIEALKPELDQLIKEMRRMIRYYEERTESKKKIEQIITMGGGSNMPGLSEYMTGLLRIPVRMCDPWQNLKLRHKLQPPTGTEKSMYVTAAGLSLIEPKELFA